MFAVLLFATVARDTLGDRGLLVAAGLSGIALLAITTAVISNTVVKAGMAIIGGGRKFGLHIVLVALLAIAAGAAGTRLS